MALLEKLILITGGAGYIGSHLAKALFQSGYQPILFDNLSTGHSQNAQYGTLIQGDLSNPAALQDLFKRYSFSVVIHLAASTSVYESLRTPQQYYQNNVVNTLHLLEAMQRANVKKLIFASSAAVYGDSLLPSDSLSKSYVPINPYGHSKRMVEILLQDYHFAYDLNYLALRYFNVAGADPDLEIGPLRKTHLIPIALDVALKKQACLTLFGQDHDTPDGTCVRDYIHIRDLCQAHLKALQLLERGSCSAQYDLGSGVGTSVCSVLVTIEQVTQCSIPVHIAPRRAGEPATLIANSIPAQMALDWMPMNSSLAQMITDTWAWALKMENHSCLPY